MDRNFSAAMKADAIQRASQSKWEIAIREKDSMIERVPRLVVCGCGCAVVVGRGLYLVVQLRVLPGCDRGLSTRSIDEVYRRGGRRGVDEERKRVRQQE
jgi:hypothetical protein